jgi:hypothetical protein
MFILLSPFIHTHREREREKEGERKGERQRKTESNQESNESTQREKKKHPSLEHESPPLSSFNEIW